MYQGTCHIGVTQFLTRHSRQKKKKLRPKQAAFFVRPRQKNSTPGFAIRVSGGKNAILSKGSSNNLRSRCKLGRARQGQQWANGPQNESFVEVANLPHSLAAGQMGGLQTHLDENTGTAISEGEPTAPKPGCKKGFRQSARADLLLEAASRIPSSTSMVFNTTPPRHFVPFWKEAPGQRGAPWAPCSFVGERGIHPTWMVCLLFESNPWKPPNILQVGHPIQLRRWIDPLGGIIGDASQTSQEVSLKWEKPL